MDSRNDKTSLSTILVVEDDVKTAASIAPYLFTAWWLLRFSRPRRIRGYRDGARPRSGADYPGSHVGLQITPADYSRVIMVGNDLERDIKGANALGLITVWLDWAPRRSKFPADASEVPQYTIKTPDALLALLDQLEDDHVRTR